MFYASGCEATANSGLGRVEARHSSLPTGSGLSSGEMELEMEALLQEAHESIEAARTYCRELQQRLKGLHLARQQVTMRAGFRRRPPGASSCSDEGVESGCVGNLGCTFFCNALVSSKLGIAGSLFSLQALRHFTRSEGSFRLPLQKDCQNGTAFTEYKA